MCVQETGGVWVLLRLTVFIAIPVFAFVMGFSAMAYGIDVLRWLYKRVCMYL